MTVSVVILQSCTHLSIPPSLDGIQNLTRTVPLDPFRGQGTRYIHTFDHHDDDDNRNKSNNHKNGTNDDNGIGHVVMSIALSTTFRQTVPGQATAPLDDNSWGVGYEYARTGNPTRGALERALAQAEQASFAVAFSSGSAAVSAILQAIVLLHSPSASSSSKTLSNQHHMLCMDDVYGGTQRYLRRILAPTHDVHVEFVDLSLYDKPKDERNQNLPFRDTTRVSTKATNVDSDVAHYFSMVRVCGRSCRTFLFILYSGSIYLVGMAGISYQSNLENHRHGSNCPLH